MKREASLEDDVGLAGEPIPAAIWVRKDGDGGFSRLIGRWGGFCCGLVFRPAGECRLEARLGRKAEGFADRERSLWVGRGCELEGERSECVPLCRRSRRDHGRPCGEREGERFENADAWLGHSAFEREIFQGKQKLPQVILYRGRV